MSLIETNDKLAQQVFNPASQKYIYTKKIYIAADDDFEADIKLQLRISDIFELLGLRATVYCFFHKNILWYHITPI